MESATMRRKSYGMKTTWMKPNEIGVWEVKISRWTMPTCPAQPFSSALPKQCKLL